MVLFDANTWYFDAAADCFGRACHRRRRFPAEGWELLAYEDGYWYVNHRLQERAWGKSKTQEGAKKRAVAVYGALRGRRVEVGVNA